MKEGSTATATVDGPEGSCRKLRSQFAEALANLAFIDNTNGERYSLRDIFMTALGVRGRQADFEIDLILDAVVDVAERGRGL